MEVVIIYNMNIKVIVLSKAGTINEFTSISPSVPRRRKKEAKAIIIRVPIILGIPKNWLISAPLPAKIIEALEIK